MKLNKIILGLTVCAGLFTACTSEEQIGGTPEGEATTFSIKIASSDAATKAVATNYKYATDDEINVNNVMVAVFKANGTSVGDLVSGPTTVSSSALTLTTSSDGKKAYEITNLVGKTGSAYILVIANSSADYSACKSYSDFAKVTASVNDGKSFVSNNLVKVGLKQVDLVEATTKPIYEVPMNQVAARIDLKLNPADGLTYQFNKVTVANINTKSDLLINGTNTQDGTVATTEFNLTAATDTFSFYTFENPISTKRIKVSFEGTLTETATNNVTANKVYSFTFGENILHGYVYDVKGALDAKTRKMNFNWNLLAWGGSRETETDIQQAKYLVVKDLNIAMPNVTDTLTTFASSSPIESVEVSEVSNGSYNTNLKYSVTFDQGVKNGSIYINSELPINFVPKYLTLVVTNQDGLSQTVNVIQYPPLYISNETTGETLSGSDGQNNTKMYTFNVLVSNLSAIPYPDEFDEQYTIYGNSHSHPSVNEEEGKGYADYLRNNAYIGYPALDNNGCTVNTDANNKMLSPNFMLASQYGINGIGNYTTKRDFCANYSETNDQGVTYSDWRMPTLAELYMIDVMQNVKVCDVKAILEGNYYWSASTSSVQMMDPRLAYHAYNNCAVRCVRDIK
jgi:hypothetical protein